jgi:hypothetical protein
MKLEYHGAFEVGTAGCFTEDQLREDIANRGSTTPRSAPSSPPMTSSLTATEEVSKSK